MKHLLILPLAILLFVSCVDNSKTLNQTDSETAENDTENFPTFQIYGELLPVDCLNGENSITEKYGFRMERISGCNVGVFQAIIANINNKVVLEKLNAKYGNNWQANFEKETGYKLWIPLD